LISLACLIQHLFFMVPHWITFTIIGVYVLCITGFILLMKKSVFALRILLISAVLIFLLEALMLVSRTYSLVLLLLLLYLTVIVALLFTGETQQQLRKKSIAQKEEMAKWDGII
jgi:hypothetical protein